MKTRYFFDMDGTMAVWNNVSNEELYKENYFLNLEPNFNMVELVNQMLREGKEVYSCSHFLTDSQYALEEKNKWLDKYVPSLDKEHRVFIPYGQSKAEYFNEHGLTPIILTDFLIDDYTPNLLQWEEMGGTGIKFLNGINHTHGTWKGIKINDLHHIYNQMYSNIKSKMMETENCIIPNINQNGVTYMCVMYTDNYTVYVNGGEEVLVKNNKEDFFYQEQENYQIYSNLITDILANEVKPLFDMVTKEYALLHNIYDANQWVKDGTFSAKPGQEITKDVYNQLFNCMIPLSLPSNESKVQVSAGFMMGEPYDYKNGQHTYLAFGQNKYGYYYLGEMDKNGNLYNLEEENKLESEEDIEME